MPYGEEEEVVFFPSTPFEIVSIKEDANKEHDDPGKYLVHLKEMTSQHCTEQATFDLDAEKVACLWTEPDSIDMDFEDRKRSADEVEMYGSDSDSDYETRPQKHSRRG
jgi:hypothetical protein